MWPILKTIIIKKLQLKESWIIFFILGIIMLNYPFIHIFSKPLSFLGIPLLYLYLQLGWLISIVVVVLFKHAIDAMNHDSKNGEDR